MFAISMHSFIHNITSPPFFYGIVLLFSVCTKVAHYMLSGRDGVQVNKNEAVALLEERVKDKDYDAMWMLGLCLEYGMGTEKDTERAMILYRESYDQGNVVSQFLLNNGRGGRGTGTMKVEEGDLSYQIKKRLDELVSVAPWTKLEPGLLMVMTRLFPK